MTFVIASRKEPKWHVVDPLRDARECPECLAAVYGRQSRAEHRASHIERREFDSRVLAALEKISRHVGLNVVMAAEDELYDGAGELDDLDDRLTRKARAVAELDDYDEKEDAS
jgi:hypothetical protein